MSKSEAAPWPGPELLDAASGLLSALRSAGARFDGGEAEEDGGPAVPAAFGDPEAEYRALRETVGLLAGTDRRLVRVRGERARELTGGLLTNDVAGLPPGRSLYTFLLTPKGRPVAELRALVLAPDELLLDLPAACAEGALEHLGTYLPPRLVRFELDPDTLRLSLVGPRSAEAAAALPGRDPEELRRLDPLAIAGAGEPRGGEDTGTLLVAREPVEGPGHDLYVPAADAAAVWRRLADAAAAAGGRPAGAEPYEIWRVERGLPVYGREIGPDCLPQETGQESRAIDYESGCYVGQEVVARIHFRGKVNRRLAGLRFPSAPPPAGAELFRGERSRGTVTSPVTSPVHGPIALGYVRREVEEGERLALSSGGASEAEVVPLPFERPQSPPA